MKFQKISQSASERWVQIASLVSSANPASRTRPEKTKRMKHSFTNPYNSLILKAFSFLLVVSNHQFFVVGCIRVGLKPLFFDETKDRLVSVKKPNLFRKFDCVRVRQNNSSEKAVNGISFRLVSEKFVKSSD